MGLEGISPIESRTCALAKPGIQWLENREGSRKYSQPEGSCLHLDDLGGMCLQPSLKSCRAGGQTLASLPSSFSLQSCMSLPGIS